MSDKFTVLFAGRRGVPGLKGDKGDQGDPGRSINMRGIWASGTTYAPGDAVTDDSTAAQGIFSLFVQRDTAPSSVSNTSPRLDPGRWSEVGATDLSNVTGAIWRVVQNAHGFTGVGQPVTFSQPADRWVLATNSLGQPSAVAVVREIISPNEVILQGSGEISGLDPAIITPGPAAQFTPGRFYYASSAPGFLTESPTVSAVNFTSNAMLLATGPASGVVLQWQATPNTVGLRPVAMNSFFYDAAPGQTVITGVDLDGNTLAYTTADQMRVLVGGVDVSGFDGFTATTGTSVTLATALVGGERIEVRVLAEPLAALVPGTAAVVDSIQTLFDGVSRRFPLTVGAGTAVTLGPAQNVLVWLDGNAQEPNVDYLIVAGVSTASDIEFSVAPAPGTRFWAIVGLPTANALPAIASFTDLTVTNLLRATAFETANAQISGPISGTAVTQSETDGTAGRVVRVQDGDIRYGQQFDTRAAYMAWVAAGGVAVNGRAYLVGGLQFVGSTGATVTGLPGLLPAKNATFEHFGAVGNGVVNDQAALQAAINAGLPILEGTPGAIYRCNSAVLIPSNTTIDLNGARIRRGFVGGPFVLRSANSYTTWDNEEIHLRNIWIDDDGTTATRGGGLNLAGDRITLDGYRYTCTAPYDGVTGCNAIYVTGKNITFRRIWINSQLQGTFADGVHAAYLENFTMTDFHIETQDDAIALHPDTATFPWTGKNLTSKNIDIQGGYVSSLDSNGIRIGAWGVATIGTITPKPNVVWTNVNVDMTIGQCGTSCLELVDTRNSSEVAAGLKNTDITIRARIQEQDNPVRLLNVQGSPNVSNVANLSQRNYGRVRIDLEGAVSDSTSENLVYAGGFDYLEISGSVRYFDATSPTLTHMNFFSGNTLVLDGLTTQGSTNGTFANFKWIENIVISDIEHLANGTSEFQTFVLTQTPEVDMSFYMRGGRVLETARAITIAGTGRIKDFVVSGTTLANTVTFPLSGTFTNTTWVSGGVVVYEPAGGYSSTVANLLGSSVPVKEGHRAFVTDANATTFASTVAAGGANKVPVYRDGTVWKIG